MPVARESMTFGGGTNAVLADDNPFGRRAKLLLAGAVAAVGLMIAGAHSASAAPCGFNCTGGGGNGGGGGQTGGGVNHGGNHNGGGHGHIGQGQDTLKKIQKQVNKQIRHEFKKNGINSNFP